MSWQPKGHFFFKQVGDFRVATSIFHAVCGESKWVRNAEVLSIMNNQYLANLTQNRPLQSLQTQLLKYTCNETSDIV